MKLKITKEISRLIEFRPHYRAEKGIHLQVWFQDWHFSNHPANLPSNHMLLLMHQWKQSLWSKWCCTKNWTSSAARMYQTKLKGHKALMLKHTEMNSATLAWMLFGFMHALRQTDQGSCDALSLCFCSFQRFLRPPVGIELISPQTSGDQEVLHGPLWDRLLWASAAVLNTRVPTSSSGSTKDEARFVRAGSTRTSTGAPAHDCHPFWKRSFSKSPVSTS